MRFWMARLQRGTHHAVVGAVALLLALTASAASAVQVDLPDDAAIASVGATTAVNMTIGANTGVLAGEFNFTYDATIVTTSPGNVAPGGVLPGGCNLAPSVSEVAGVGSVTIGLACTQQLTGAGTLFSITFQGVANGVSALTFTTVEPNIPNGCKLNEGTPTCEPDNGQITVGPPPPSATPTATTTVTLTATVTGTATDTATASPTGTSSSTPTASSTATVTSTQTATGTPTHTQTPSQTATVTGTATASATATTTATATSTPVPTPRITGGGTEGSTRVFGTGAGNIPSPLLEIRTEGGELLGTGGTDAGGSFNDGSAGIGLSRPLVSGDRILPIDTQNGLSGPVVAIGGPPAPIPTVNHFGAAVLAALLASALIWRLLVLQRRR